MTTRDLLQDVAAQIQEGRYALLDRDDLAAGLRTLAKRLDEEEARARAIAGAGESSFEEATAKDRIELIARLDADLG